MHRALLLLCAAAICAAQTWDFSQCSLGLDGIRIGRTISLSGLYQAESLLSRYGHDFWLEYQNNVAGGIIFNNTRCKFT